MKDQQSVLKTSLMSKQNDEEVMKNTLAFKGSKLPKAVMALLHTPFRACLRPIRPMRKRLQAEDDSFIDGNKGYRKVLGLTSGNSSRMLVVVSSID